ncbi:unnamed protein product [Brachionus calyciflorus]|uniref:Uncharacterized protein n=1 Tax=Brachionus calyciflorus TaxID=104777 RepID=A0A813MRD9_9BILA|nr:unnamed protein product [Brachionus calyciflorus]
MKLFQVLLFNLNSRRCESEDKTASQVYVEELSNLCNTTGISLKEGANNENFKTFDSVKSTLQRRKSKLRPKLPNSLKDTKIEGDYLKTNEGKKFLILNRKNKILVFASSDGLECLSKCEFWAGDGTFHVAAKYFYQLYIIHGYYESNDSMCFCTNA